MKENLLSKILLSNAGYIFLSLSLIGISDTSYIFFNEYFNAGECQLLGSSCGEVLTSRYSRLFYLPLSIWGLIYFLVLFNFSFNIQFQSKQFYYPFFFLNFLGCLFSWYLFHLQANVIKAWCPLCLVSLGLNNLILFLIIILYFLSPTEKKFKPNTLTWVSSLKTLIITTLSVAFFFKVVEDFKDKNDNVHFENFEEIVGIIEDTYIKVSDVDPLINNIIFIEKNNILNARKKALEFILLEKVAMKKNLSLPDYLVQEKIIKEKEKYDDFLQLFYLTHSKELKQLLTKLKKELFYRELLF